jgi:hypothetical protein
MRTVLTPMDENAENGINPVDLGRRRASTEPDACKDRIEEATGKIVVASSPQGPKAQLSLSPLRPD